MPAFLCETCGSQFTPSDQPPPACPVCQDERQFVPPGGQGLAYPKKVPLSE